MTVLVVEFISRCLLFSERASYPVVWHPGGKVLECLVSNGTGAAAVERREGWVAIALLVVLTGGIAVSM